MGESPPDKERDREENSQAFSKAPTLAMAQELEDLKKKVKELEAKAGSSQVSTPAASQGCPFSLEIVSEPLPAHFKATKIREYDGNSDPDEHLTRFENMAMLHCYSDKINSSKRYKKTAFSLFEVKQSGDESLRAYIRRFNKASLEVPACAPETKTTAFTQGLKEGDFFRYLVKKQPGNFEDLLSRVEKYINMEEAQWQKRESARRERNDRVGKVEDNARGNNLGRFSRYAPMKPHRGEGVHLCSGDQGPKLYRSLPSLPHTLKMCSYHGECAHSTSECQRLKRAPSQSGPGEQAHLTKKSRGPPWVNKDAGYRPGKKGQDRQEKKDNTDQTSRGRENRDGGGSPTLGVIKMISGGSTDGDSNRARKAHSRHESFGVEDVVRDEGPVISFGPRDLQGVSLPHNDALVIQAKVANYDIRWVFIDSGSSLNIIFQEVLDQMNLEGYQLQPVETALFGFAGHTVYPRGEITLPLTIGAEELRKTVMTVFTVVSAPTSYNIILGRPAMNAFRAVASAYHQKLKFPVRNRVGEVWGDKPSSRKCYAETVKIENKRARRGGESRRPWKEEVHSIQHVRMVEGDEQEEVSILPGQPTKTTKIARDLEPATRAQLLQCLEKNADIFAWSSSELVGIYPHVAEHKLNIIPGSRAVKQRKRHFSPEKDKVIADHVGELLRAGQIREVQFPTWLSNVVLVTQISRQMEDVWVPSDPLGPGRSGEGYSPSKPGRNIEVYVDDILVKSRAHTELIPDLEETFSTLREYGVRLNPAKCTFGVKSGKFLGFMVTERGIEVNPEKVRSITEMTSPKSVKDVQRLTGRIAALSRFIFRSAHRSYPFFQALRKAKEFGWDEKCEKAFEELKNHLAGLPVLEKPGPGEKLWVYLSATEYAVSSVLIREEGTDQRPVYYVSHALKGPEVRYTEVEKVALALVITARKLRPYFLSHPITVLTNTPLGRIMTQPEISGRLVKWNVELGEYDIEYQPRKAIKAQALSNFITEIIVPDIRGIWRIFVDGASGKDGSGVGVLLISPTEKKIQLAVRLDFRASNNEAEYEAVIIGIKAARDAGATRVIIYTDSQLVAQQVKGAYEAREGKFVKYLTIIKELSAHFIDWSIEQIPREKNTEADVLAKMAASLSDYREPGISYHTSLVSSVDTGPPQALEDNWSTPILDYISRSYLPEDVKEASQIKKRAARFVVINDILYRRSFQGPLLKCISGDESIYVLREIHEGCCGDHIGATSLARKALLAGFWWPTMHQDDARVVRSCEGCQRHSNINHHPTALMKPIRASCPFDQWGLDIVGSFLVARAQKKFMLIGIDYFSKWVEAEPLAKITEEEVLKFLWKNIVCRFGISRKLISDNGRQLQGNKVRAWCEEMKITQAFTSVAYPQANGQTEVTNRTIVQALRARLYGVGKDWVEELPSVLWAYRATPRTATGETPFSLVYGSEAVLPAEIGQTSTRVHTYPEDNDNARASELDLIEERRERAAIKMEAYRRRVMKAYNQRVRHREFQIGDMVLKKPNPAGDVGKLDARWEGPYKVVRRVSSGAYYLEDEQGRPLKRPWNAFTSRNIFLRSCCKFPVITWQ
ncbi:uncharacterized protein [Primulina eburnea]|uniref:uncharacterized protein n=1 Tax=Primulina eburnea TaxID=1245227 RepID=UPI003C6BF616